MKNPKKQTKTHLILFAIAAFMVILFSACKEGCRNCKDCKDITTREVSITNPIVGVIFDGPWDVNIVQDSLSNSAVIEYCSSHENQIVAELLPNGYLHLKVRWGNYHHHRDVLRANIKATSLEKIEASGATSIRTTGYFGNINNISLSGASDINGLLGAGTSTMLTLTGASTIKDFSFTGNNMNAELSGASDLKCTNLVLDYFTADCSGASTMRSWGGNITKASFNGSGASDFETLEMRLDDLDIDLSGASNATVLVNNVIKGKLTGASTLKYKGAANVSGVSTSGSSKIICLN